MSSLLLLNIGHDLANLIVKVINYLNEARKETPQLKLVLWPVVYALTFAKVFINNFANGATILMTEGRGFSWLYRVVSETLFAGTPNSIYCFNKTGFLIFFADMYFLWLYYFKVLKRPELAYTYLLLKLLSIIMPFLLLSPVDRLPFWFLGVVLTMIECPVGLWLMTSWGYGIDWKNANFYRKWKKHYHYKRPTTNRDLTVELCQYAYVVSKALILCDYFCFNKELRTSRLQAPHTPTKGAFLISDLEPTDEARFDYLNNLLEESSTAGLWCVALVVLVTAIVVLHNARSSSRSIAPAVYIGATYDSLVEVIASNAYCLADLEKSIVEREAVLEQLRLCKPSSPEQALLLAEQCEKLAKIIATNIETLNAIYWNSMLLDVCAPDLLPDEPHWINALPEWVVTLSDLAASYPVAAAVLMSLCLGALYFTPSVFGGTVVCALLCFLAAVTHVVYSCWNITTAIFTMKTFRSLLQASEGNLDSTLALTHILNECDDVRAQLRSIKPSSPEEALLLLEQSDKLAKVTALGEKTIDAMNSTGDRILACASDLYPSGPSASNSKGKSEAGFAPDFVDYLITLFEESSIAGLWCIALFLLIVGIVALRAVRPSSRNISAAVPTGEIHESLTQIIKSNDRCVADLQKNIAECEAVLEQLRLIEFSSPEQALLWAQQCEKLAKSIARDNETLRALYSHGLELNACASDLLPGGPSASNTKGKSEAGFALDFDYLSTLLEQDSVANLRYGVLFLLALSSLGVYSIILAGWSSNSKYAFIGALRSAAQMISYEVAISLIILPVVLLAGSLNLTMITHIQNITTWFLWPLLPVSVLFLIAMLAETNRTPFDLPEAEAELVAGYNVDYSSLPFAMFFLGEYCNMILISTLYCILFLGGGLNTLGLSSSAVLATKAAVTWVFFVLVRATLPRYRYDQLMDIGWKVFLPISGSFLLVVFGILVYFDALPVANELPLTFGAHFARPSAVFPAIFCSELAPSDP